MTVDDMTAQSTLKPERTSNSYAPGPSTIAGSGGSFEFDVAGTGLKFEGCRYYFISSYTNEPSRIESISIGTSHAKISRAALNKANAEVQARLAADGWLTGHEEYRTEEDRTPHGGQTRGEEGWLWLNNDTTLHLLSRRLDDPVAGEDPATAGEWIQYVDLWEKKSYPYIERYVFAPPSK